MANDFTVLARMAQPCGSQAAGLLGSAGRERLTIGSHCIWLALHCAKEQLLERRAGVNIGGSQWLETEREHG